jgi:pimeloyl-ACP methyl ester carboxylesterase/DNA-binding CsgD family transcriptional regulator
VAYSTAGSGPVLLMDPGWVTHLRAQLQVGSFASFLDGLARHFTVVRFDKPGCGLSDHEGLGSGFAGQVSGVLAVADAVRARRFGLFGASQGGQVAIAVAARRPDRVESLVLYGTCGNGADLAPSGVREALSGLVSGHWGLGSRVLTDIFVPDAGPEEVDSFARFQRASASAGVARDLLDLYYTTDVSDLLPLIQARTAVLHREGDTATAFGLGRQVAAAIPGAVLVPLAGRAHLFYFGDWEAVLAAMVDFLLPAEAGSFHLTPREVDVARLVAAGLTNHAIAAELRIAARTVDTHVGNIRGKLGARSRAQVAAWITEHDDGHRVRYHGDNAST